MGRVRRLDSHLVDQIAAGEVVERPGSVAKELIENALDAEAARVDVEANDGGVTLLSVTDDGVGMSEEDAWLAVERHATSKIAAVADLAQLRTFGFRGEALPSIASVSRLRLVTREAAASAGVEMVIEGERRDEPRPCAATVGTRVEVRDLFFNVPARRKFLKSTATESAQVTDAVFYAALARPDVTFTLTREGRRVREYLRAPSREARVRDVLGGEELTRVVFERGPLRGEALLGPPERARAGAMALHLLVNGRPIRDRSLARAVAHAYGSILEGGRYPIGVLYLDLPADFVDVNVHPQKAEVRFQDARALFETVARGLGPELTRVFSVPGAIGPSGGGQTGPSFSRPSTGAAHTTAPALQGAFARAGAYTAAVLPAGESALADEPSLFRSVRFYGGLRYVGQLKSMFLLCEGSDGLYVLDQHASHERVTFDRLKKAYDKRDVAVQRLLAPEVVEVSEAEAARIDDDRETIERMGLDVRRIGKSAIAVASVPALLHKRDPARLLRDLLAEVSREGDRPFTAAVDRVLATMACHGSVRAGEAVEAAEVAALLAALDDVDFAGYCPHGRPVITRIGFDELERKVGR